MGVVGRLVEMGRLVGDEVVGGAKKKFKQYGPYKELYILVIAVIVSKCLYVSQ